MASIHNTGGQGPVYQGTPDQALKEMHGLLDAGYGKLAHSKVLGSENSIAFAKICLTEVGKLLEQTKGVLSETDQQKVVQKKTELEAKIGSLDNPLTRRESVGKLWNKVFGSLFHSEKAQLGKLSSEELAVLYHSDKAETGGKQGAIKEAFLAKGDKLASDFEKMTTENDPAKLRQYIKSGMHQELLDYHFAALKIDPENKQSHIDAIATLMVRAKMINVDFMDPRIKETPEISKAVFAKAEEILDRGNHDTPLHLKGVLLNKLGDLLPPSEVREIKAKARHKINPADLDTQEQFLKEVGLQGSKKPIDDLAKIASKEMKSRTPEGFEKARLALLIGHEMVGTDVPHGKDWDKAASTYVKSYMSGAVNLMRFKADKAALATIDTAVEIYQLRTTQDKNTHALGNKMKPVLEDARIKDAMIARTTLKDATSLVEQCERAADEAQLVGSLSGGLAEENTPVGGAKQALKELKAMKGKIDDLSREHDTAALPVQETYAAAVARAEFAVTRAELSAGKTPTNLAPPPPLPPTSPVLTESMVSFASTSTLSTQTAASTASPITESPFARLDAVVKRREYSALLGGKPVDSPLRPLGELYMLKHSATTLPGKEGDLKLVEAAIQKRLNAANELNLKLVKMKKGTEIRKALDASPSAFKDLLEHALILAEEGAGKDENQHYLVAIYVKATLAGVKIDAPTSFRIESLKWEEKGHKSLFLMQLEASPLAKKQPVIQALAQTIPNWGSPERQKMRAIVSEVANGDIRLLKSYANRSSVQEQRNRFKSLFQGHVKLALLEGHPLKEQSLDFLADMLIFRARSGVDFHLDQRDIQLLNKNPEAKAAILQRVGAQLEKLPPTEGQVALYNKIENTLA